MVMHDLAMAAISQGKGLDGFAAQGQVAHARTPDVPGNTPWAHPGETPLPKR